MGFRQSDLQPAFEGPGSQPFRIWGFGTSDPLEEVLGPAYMRSGGSILAPGDLIYVRTCPRRQAAGGREVGETRVALLMVVGWERNAMRLRLVQDFGRPEDGAPSMPASGPGAAAPAPVPAAPPPAPAVPTPAVPMPAFSAPAVSGPAVPGPAVPTPAVSGPAIPAPAVSAPAGAMPALADAAAEAPAAPPRRGRGRPPGSRSKQAAFRLPAFR